MDKHTATAVFDSLASTTRLDVFKCLVRKGPDGMVAGDIAAALDISASNLSFHLKDMVHKQLLSVTQEGRFLRYRANMALMQDLVAYLMAECCVDSQNQSC